MHLEKMSWNYCTELNNLSLHYFWTKADEVFIVVKWDIFDNVSTVKRGNFDSSFEENLNMYACCFKEL